MPTIINFCLEFTMTLVVFGLLAKWYIWPYLQKLSFISALILLTLPHLLRYLGMASLSPIVVDPAFTQTSYVLFQAYGDFIAMLLALVSVVALRIHWKYAIGLVWIFNIFGSLDLMNSILHGLLSQVVQYQLGAFWYTPVVLVPILIIAHTMSFVLLTKRSKEYGKN